MVDMVLELESDTIGAYHSVEATHRGSVAVEINNGETVVIVYLTPEEARLMARDLINEAANAEGLVA